MSLYPPVFSVGFQSQSHYYTPILLGLLRGKLCFFLSFYCFGTKNAIPIKRKNTNSHILDDLYLFIFMCRIYWFLFFRVYRLINSSLVLDFIIVTVIESYILAYGRTLTTLQNPFQFFWNKLPASYNFKKIIPNSLFRLLITTIFETEF